MDMKSFAKYGLVVGALLGAAAATWAIGELSITNPADDTQVKPGQVVRITWRNCTTNPVDVWLKWDGRRAKIGAYGNETDGIRPVIRKSCDALVRIPLASGLDSLNVAVAAGIALFRGPRT